MPASEGQNQELNSGDRCILVCQNTSCQRNNSAEVLKVFETETKNLVDVKVESSGCLGQCSTGPTVRVIPDEVWYYRVKPQDVSVIVEQHLKNNKPVDEMLNPRIHRRFYY
ncbi:MAG: (2Fe-2S) ferredoxin domain-containing protein [Microcoleaceae cyanobacterium MO_207.B10]|nr:(2Fe-2S) ferredoxin domain-containing protein [Microcoleaceae cyanobacterium MO_207.B10]